MIKFSKFISSKWLLISISIFNSFILISFIFFLLLGSGLLDNIYYLVAFPIDYLSSNYLVMVFLLLTELLVLIYSWYSNKKKNDISENNRSEESFINNDDIIEISSLFDEDFLNEDTDIDEPFTNIEEPVIENNLESELSFTNQMEAEHFINENDDYDLTPSHFTNQENTHEVNDIQSQVVAGSNNDLKIERNCEKKSGVNDYQYAFYQNIVNDGWLYEKSVDRERIGFDRYALDEAKISLTDIENLIETGMIYKQIINHPSGSFTVYSSRLDIEKFIIKETIRRIIRKKRLKFSGRKFEFISWQEFGLAKKIWEFDLEITELQIIGSIWINDAFLVNDINLGNNSITKDKKEELKALIATASLKMKDEGKALIITNTKENSKIIRKFVKNTGWGVISVLNFSDSNFEKKFLKLIEESQ